MSAVPAKENGVTSMTPNHSRSRLEEVCQRLKADPGLPKPNPTQSYWQVPEKVPIATLQSSEWVGSTDVVIIGSGISGCSIARHILQGDESLRVTIVEARKITSGATGRNGGHIKAIPEYSYPELLPVLGKEGADEVVHFTLANVDELMNVASTLSPELQKYCEVRMVESLNIFSCQDEIDEFKESIKTFKGAHPGRGRFIDKEEMREKWGVHNAAGAYSTPAGAGWPYRLVTGIYADLLDQYPDRFKIEARTPVESITYSKDKSLYTVHTTRGSIEAKHVIHATNGHAGHLLPKIRGALFPIRGQMTAQSPSKSFGVQGGGRSWSIHYGHGFDYMTQSGQSGEIFHGGGLAQSDQRGLAEMGNTNDDCNSALAVAHLTGIINAVWSASPNDPATTQLLAAWTGVMGFTADGLPLVGQLTEDVTGRSGSREWITAGFNGYGMCNAWLCGKHIADTVMGKETDGLLPQCYRISSERLKGMDPADAVKRWMAVLGVDG